MWGSPPDASGILTIFAMYGMRSSCLEDNILEKGAFRFTHGDDDDRGFNGQLSRYQRETQAKVLKRTLLKDNPKVETFKEETEDNGEVRSIRRNVEEDEVNDEGGNKDSRNLTETFVAVIAQGILSVPSKRMTLSSIYKYIANTFPHFDKEKGPGWRNSVRHNLSSNDCFVKASRAENGKGHYWMIHPKDLPEFSKGNFRRPRKPRRSRCGHPIACSAEGSLLGLPLSASFYPYHRKPSTNLDVPKPHPPSEAFPRPFGVSPSRYEYLAGAEDNTGYPLSHFHGFSTPPPPYGLFWQDNPSFRNYGTHFQSCTFHPYLYRSPVSKLDNAVGISYTWNKFTC